MSFDSQTKKYNKTLEKLLYLHDSAFQTVLEQESFYHRQFKSLFH